jgi:hypothetical protein
VDKVLREKEEFVRNAFLFLQDDIYPATSKVPTGREIEQRFVEQVYQAPSFVTLRIAEKLMQIRKTVGFVPADKPLRFNL